MISLTDSCIIIEDMGVCLKPGRLCKYFTVWELSSTCKYNIDGRCCHSAAITSAYNKGNTYRLVKITPGEEEVK